MSKILLGNKAWCWLPSVAVTPARKDAWFMSCVIQLWFLWSRRTLRLDWECLRRQHPGDRLKNGCFSAQSPLWNYTTSPYQHGFVTTSPNRETPKNRREPTGSRQTCLVWNGNMQGCTEEHEKSCKTQTLYKIVCGRRWTVKSSNEALKLPLLFFVLIHFLRDLFLKVPVPSASPEIVLNRCSSLSCWLLEGLIIF